MIEFFKDLVILILFALGTSIIVMGCHAICDCDVPKKR
jgi:hypothetical protein